MNQSCLYCYRTLEEGQVDFHDSCATDLFGCSTVSSYPFAGDVGENYRAEELREGYIPQLEALAMRFAQSALILTVPNTLVPSADGTLRYIKKWDSSRQSIEQLVESLEGCEFDGSFEMIAELVEDFSSIAKLDLVTLFEQLIMGWVVGCNTMGLSSFALTRPNAGVCSLAPIMALEPQIDSAGDELAVEVNGKRKNLRRADFESAMRFMGLKDRIIRITIEKIINAREQWAQIAESSPLEEETKSRFWALVCARLARLNK